VVVMETQHGLLLLGLSSIMQSLMQTCNDVPGVISRLLNIFSLFLFFPSSSSQ
jgi:hypothetical protein